MMPQKSDSFIVAMKRVMTAERRELRRVTYQRETFETQEVYETMSVEELMRTKETIEDLIAEKEMQEQSITVEAGKPGIAEA